MDIDLAPIDVAHHWPFIRSNLHLERWPAADRALAVLASRQLECGGQAVAFGTTFWRSIGLTPGQIGATSKALCELERRRVVAGYRGAGRRGNSWTFVPSIRHWAGMPWGGRGRNVESVVGGCACRAPRPVVALVPGQRVGLSRTAATFRLSAADHLQRPGLSPGDERDYGAAGATTGQRPGRSPGDERDYGADRRPPFLSAGELTFSVEGAEQRFALLTQEVETVCDQPLYGPRVLLRVKALAERLTDDQVAVLLKLLSQRTDRLYIPKVIDVLDDLTTEPEVKRAARLHAVETGHPAGTDLVGKPASYS